MDLMHYENVLNATVTALDRMPLHQLDHDADALADAFDLCYRAGLFAFYRYDTALHEAMKFTLFSHLTPRSGSLAFLGIQILAANKIMHANDFDLKAAYFASRCGIAINHLRAPKTVVKATRDGSFYRLSGKLTWASGYGIFDTLIAGFHCEGEELQAVVPFEAQSGFSIGAPMETFVGNAMRTVDIVLDAYTVPAAHIVAVHPLGTYTQNKSVSRTVHYALYGIGLGAVNAMTKHDMRDAAARKLTQLQEAFLSTTDGETLDRLRNDLFAVVQHVITAGMVQEGGKSVLMDRTLQRYCREIIMFNANGLNAALKARHRDMFLSAMHH